MEAVYFDSSAFVKLLVEEQDSPMAAELWDNSDIVLASHLAYVEVCAALAASHRSHGLDDGSYRSAIRAWESYWAAVRPVELTAAVESSAGRLAASRSLRGADAVHLASALAVGIDDLVLAVWDRRLHEAAVAERLSVAPVSLS